MSISRQRMALAAVATAAAALLAPTASWAWTSSSSSLLSRPGFARFATRRYMASSSSSSPDDDDLSAVGLNELQTILRAAADRQDFATASKCSDELSTRLFGSSDKSLRKRMSWSGLGVPAWLDDRLGSLNYTFPTTIQITSLEAVSAILHKQNLTDALMVQIASDLSTSVLRSIFGEDEREVTVEDIQNSKDVLKDDLGIVISGNTGAGKTLAYLVPMLSILSEAFFNRQQLRVGAEEKVGDTTGNLLERVAVVTSPVMRSNRRKAVRDKGAIATGASLATLGKEKHDVKSPLALIVVPTRELGLQTAMQLYELVGGSIKKDATELRDKANMFRYSGPKGIRIGCILEEEEAEFGLKLQTDIAITSPKFLSKLLADGDINPSKLRVVAFDEADLALEVTKADDLQRLFGNANKYEVPKPKPDTVDDLVIDVSDETDIRFEADYPDTEEEDARRLTFLVGASVTKALGNLAIRSHVLPIGKSFIATATEFAPLLAEREVDSGGADSDGKDESTPAGMSGEQPKVASLKDLNACLDPGLRHERVRIADDVTGLLVLTKLLRKELQDYEARKAEDDTSPRPRVVVFFPDEDSARAAIEPLRDALWGDHKLCVLLPKTGQNPITMFEQFKAGETSVMLATPNSVRGLDFPELSHVYTLYLPTDDPREYVHLAGRVGRVGQMGSARGHGGRVVSILKEQEADGMDLLANELEFEFTDTSVESSSVLPRNSDGELDMDSVDIEKMRRLLDDTMSLVSLADDVEIDPEAVKRRAALMEEDYDDDDDEDEEDEEDETDTISSDAQSISDDSISDTQSITDDSSSDDSSSDDGDDGDSDD